VTYSASSAFSAAGDVTEGSSSASSAFSATETYLRLAREKVEGWRREEEKEEKVIFSRKKRNNNSPTVAALHAEKAGKAEKGPGEGDNQAQGLKGSAPRRADGKATCRSCGLGMPEARLDFALDCTACAAGLTRRPRQADAALSVCFACQRASFREESWGSACDTCHPRPS
jgi:hypothetical protein